MKKYKFTIQCLNCDNSETFYSQWSTAVCPVNLFAFERLDPLLYLGRSGSSVQPVSCVSCKQVSILPYAFHNVGQLTDEMTE